MFAVCLILHRDQLKSHKSCNSYKQNKINRHTHTPEKENGSWTVREREEENITVCVTVIYVDM